MKRKHLLLFVVLLCAGCSIVENKHEESSMKYKFPSEKETHEGTWLNWPHHYTYGMEYREEIEDIWITMAYELHHGENVHIVAYDETEKTRITQLLVDNEFDMNKIDFVIAKTDDVWSRDTGPMFVRDENDKLVIANFKFDGWGNKVAYENDDNLPQAIAKEKDFTIVDIPDFVLEGGSVELDGTGTAMLTKSSVVSKNRNSNMSMKQAEEYMTKYLGATNFIWLEGVLDEDITDAHIDGMARFYDDKTLLTVSREDFLMMYENIEESDYDVLMNAKNAQGKPYDVIRLPMTEKNVEHLDYKGSYLNYYVGNDVVLVPVYNDVNDQIALDKLAELYTDKEIKPINVTALYEYGGMLHCITQQQPAQ